MLRCFDVVICILEVSFDLINQLTIPFNQQCHLREQLQQVIYCRVQLQNRCILLLDVADCILDFRMRCADHLLLHEFLGCFRVITQLLKLLIGCITFVQTYESFKLVAHCVFEVACRLRRCLN